MYPSLDTLDVNVTVFSPAFQMSSKLCVILDFDGTLSGLAKTPELAFICPESKKSLERLSNMADVHVAIISGRNLEDLREKVLLHFSCVLSHKSRG